MIHMYTKYELSVRGPQQDKQVLEYKGSTSEAGNYEMLGWVGNIQINILPSETAVIGAKYKIR